MKCIVDWLLRIVYEESLVSDIGRACLMEVGYKSRWWARFNHVCDKFGLWELVNLLWLKNINKEGMAMLGMKYDRNVWKKTLVARIQEDGRRQWRNGFGINERELQYVHMKSQPKNEKYANGSVGARVRLMVRGGCLPVRGSKGMDWKYDDDLCVCGTKETEIHVLFECKCYDMVRRRWLRTWDVLEEKERTMGVIKGYVQVNDDVENKTMKYLGEVWTERQRNERNRVNVIP